MTKFCKFCSNEYDSDSEHWYKNTKTGTLSCKKRSKERATKWQVENREKSNDNAKKSYLRNREFRRDYQRYKRYGIAPETYAMLFEKQNGKCAICRTDDWGGMGGTPHVDHDHNSNAIRGLLCSKCNRGIGYFNDDKGLLLEAGKYLDM